MMSAAAAAHGPSKKLEASDLGKRVNATTIIPVGELKREQSEGYQWKKINMAGRDVIGHVAVFRK